MDIHHIGLLSGVIYLIIYLIIYVTFYVLVLTGVLKFYETAMESPLLIFYIVVAIADLIINSVYEYYSSDNILFYIFAMVSELITIALIFGFDLVVKKSEDLKIEKYLSDKMLKQQEWQYEYAKASSDELKIRAHDLKHQVRILRQGGEEAEELLKELEGEIDAYDDMIVTDNQVLNIIIQEKWYYCKKHDIRLSAIVDPDAFKSMKNTDLYSLIGNVIDNAIEAVTKREEKEKRVISVEITHRNSLSILRCDNYFTGEIEYQGSVIKTSKPDEENHGIGIRSIDEIAKRNHGSMKINIDQDIFTMLITIPDSI